MPALPGRIPAHLEQIVRQACRELAADAVTLAEAPGGCGGRCGLRLAGLAAALCCRQRPQQVQVLRVVEFRPGRSQDILQGLELVRRRQAYALLLPAYHAHVSPGFRFFQSGGHLRLGQTQHHPPLL